ncbi:MAG TPA: indole-3-glycerol phosphate synthase TrpC [Planctomycetota bacterium]|jgi:indole-3-glycerol phosphate synthase|nr:indole-3-glycerol phosphate synthase TrpC [Planctomycetota bacterium]OQC20365.1 MAG: Indole-3-glycerol phosphate synthase [Planctomycetes bacterium ADurb.Bin069]HNR98650.1 indole-3-glycerol phosphate synthase TrpC [Planctomycetota bacterium]HNU25030.1 indole-3-glycerol phosphate synthase TrpC [Planctomycetota bacterium]HOE28486.1 indole-3-glycerol phosphate synthase TrpC [Planctomycetota bacterium]
MSFYDEVRAIKEREIAALRGAERGLEARAAAAAPARSLRAALNADPPAIIAEVKRASPSKGVIRADLDAAAQARKYAAGGAAAVSVLTEETYFRGSLADLAAARAAVEVPLLRKDFILHRRQLLAARANGADAALLIVGFAGPERLAKLLAAARAVGLEALVEVHDEEELARAVGAGGELIGINNRDLRTLRVDLAVSERLLPLVPAGCTAVVESGVAGPADAARLRRAGARAFLIGEYLSRAADPAAAIRELRGG